MLQNTFLAISDNRAAVHILTAGQMEYLDSGLGQASKPENRKYLYKKVFSEPVDTIFPLWVEECLSFLIEHYTGVHNGEVKRLASCALLSRPFYIEGSGDDTEGGRPADLDQPKPKQPSPSTLLDLVNS